MTSHYGNTISIVSLLFCLYITSASARSFIRQYTDDVNTNLQQENGAGPNPNLGEANYEDKYEEISSRDYKVSASNAVKGLRDRPPSSYILKMESFNTLLKSNYAERYESRPFAVGGYNWTLVVYPNGNKKDSGSGYLSLYVAIDNSTLVAAHQEVLADLRFYIFNNNERKYFTIQDTTVWRFNVFKTMWGFSQVLPVDTFKDPKNGYLYDGDHCEFGVDVIIPSIAENSELFSATEKFYNPTFTWTIRGFSTLLKDMYSSDVFTIGGRSWNIQVYPNGRGEGEGKFLSMFLKLNGEETLRPYEKVYVRAKLRVLNQSKLNNVQNQLDSWFSRAAPSWGFRKFISFDDLRDSSKGFCNDPPLPPSPLLSPTPPLPPSLPPSPPSSPPSPTSIKLKKEREREIEREREREIERERERRRRRRREKAHLSSSPEPPHARTSSSSSPPSSATKDYHRVPLVETNPWPPKTPQSESGRSRTRLRKFRLCAREVHAPPPENVATAGPPSPAAGISAVAAVDRRR